MIEQGNAKKAAGGVEYHVADESYFEKRTLKKYAGGWSLWALGVGAVISGDFSGWNLGVGQAGFGGFLVALLIVTVMYIGLCFSNWRSLLIWANCDGPMGWLYHGPG